MSREGLTIEQLFRGEFIFPTEGLTANLDRTLKVLEADNVIKVSREVGNDSCVLYIDLSSAERESGRENFDFYCFLIWPFIEASWLGAVSLMMLTPPRSQRGDVWHDMKQVQDRAQLVRFTMLASTYGADLYCFCSWVKLCTIKVICLTLRR